MGETNVFTDWLRFQRYAQDNGYDSVRFEAELPAGTIKGRWLDAHFGFIVFDGMEGFITVDRLEEISPDVVCRVLPETATGSQT